MECNLGWVIVAVVFFGIGGYSLTEEIGRTTRTIINESEFTTNSPREDLNFYDLLRSDIDATPEENKDDATLTAGNTVGDLVKSAGIQELCFFWPWIIYDCRKSMCYQRGLVDKFEICGLDPQLGFRSFYNYCYLSATNTCYSTKYVFNHTGTCV